MVLYILRSWIESIHSIFTTAKEIGMRIDQTSSTDEVLKEIGARLQRLRLQGEQSIIGLAALAGVGERTVRRAEAGDNTSLESLVRILRALSRLDAFESFIPEPLVSPIQLAENRVRERQRAYAPRKRRATPDEPSE
jgi:transcriptional regulator with XRE-family HTH domain